MEEKKLGFPFSENGPSAIQGEGATSTFSDLREWEERGVTTPSIGMWTLIAIYTVLSNWCGLPFGVSCYYNFLSRASFFFFKQPEWDKYTKCDV